MSNKSAVLYGIGDVRIEDREIPQPGPGQVQVAVKAIGVCGSDIHYYREGRINDMIVREPMVLGHEAGGVVTAVGEGVDPARVGQTVALEPGVPCKECFQCRSGRYNLCPDVRFFATPPIDGAFAEYVVLDEDYAFAAEGLSFVEAGMCEPVSVGVAASRKAGVQPGSRVLVIGAGPIGNLCAQVARAFGASVVEMVDINEQRLQVARDLGFSVNTDEVDFDVILECSGSQVALSQAFPRIARGGRLILIGMGADDVSLSLGLLQGREAWVTGTFRYANTYPLAIELIRSGKVQIAPIVTHVLPLDQAEEALLIPAKDPSALKVVVEP